jgi:hypothetical protein
LIHLDIDALILLIATLLFGSFCLLAACKSTGIYNFISGLLTFGAIGTAAFVIVRSLIGA